MNEITNTPSDVGALIRRQAETEADFTYSISGNVISVLDLNRGNRSVTNDVENVLRKIDHFSDPVLTEQSPPLPRGDRRGIFHRTS